jgi:tetratricopeptide (TPR) repeat protein
VVAASGVAEYAFKYAEVNSDYSDAAKQYEKALLLAPWLAADYFNCGVAHEKAGENQEAIRSFKFYLLAAPHADDVQTVKKRIGGLQYAAQKAEDEQNAAAREAAQQAAVYEGLDGGVWRLVQDNTIVLSNGIVGRNGRTVEDGSTWRSGDGIGRTYIRINGHEISKYQLMLLSPGNMIDAAAVTRPVDYNDARAQRTDAWKTMFASRTFKIDAMHTVTINPDGQSIKEESTWHYPDVSMMLKTTDIYERLQ